MRNLSGDSFQSKKEKNENHPILQNWMKKKNVALNFLDLEKDLRNVLNRIVVPRKKKDG